MTGPKGPEAGVWVIAETTDLPTKFARIVVTDDRGRYLLPDLPKANYAVWVRGYGLVDSPKSQTVPGKTVNLTAVPAPDARAAAQYYPAAQWLSLLRVPDKSEFPGTGPSGNGISENVKNQAQWLRQLKSGGCTACHQLGNKATRELPPGLGHFDSTAAAWERRVQSGQAGSQMLNGMNQFGAKRAFALFADWTDRIAAGEVPPAPPRPQGIERNVVITQWDWADPKSYLHDVVSTDRRNPTVNANGPVYGALELSNDYLPVLDPVKHLTSQVELTVRDPKTPPTGPMMLQPSPYWDREVLWTSKNNVHNPMFDEKGRMWITSAVRPPDNPAYCKEGSTHPSAKLFPIQRASRHLADVRSEDQQAHAHQHLLRHAPPDVRRGREPDPVDERRRTGGGMAEPEDVRGDRRRGEVAGVDGAHHGHQRQRQARRVRRARSAGRSDEGQAVRRGLLLGRSCARRLRVGLGAGIPRRAGPVESGRQPAGNRAGGGVRTAGQRSARAGILAARRGHRSQRRRVGGACQRAHGQLRSTEVQGAAQWTGRDRPALPGGMDVVSRAAPQFKGVSDPGSTEGSYYTWVDQFDTSGLGRNTPINTGNASEGLLALKDGKWVVMRVPYPLGYYTKWLDGRIDDPAAGWKGKGLWTTISTRAPFHMEGGKGTTSKVMKFQIRPDPLAR